MKNTVSIALSGIFVAFAIVLSAHSAVSASPSDSPSASTQGGTATPSCPLVTTFMKLGAKNNSAEVARLQSYLKDKQELDVDVTGIFDQKTEDAVKTFQREYLNTTMGPWDATRPSGIVYITTAKKLNELACAQPLVLNSSELAIINAYKKNISGQSNHSVTSENAPAVVVAPATTGTGETLNVSGVSAESNDQSGSQTAAAATGLRSTSAWSRFWSFIANLF